MTRQELQAWLETLTPEELQAAIEQAAQEVRIFDRMLANAIEDQEED